MVELDLPSEVKALRNLGAPSSDGPRAIPANPATPATHATPATPA